MCQRILNLVAACLYYSGLVAFVRLYTERRGKRLIILNYHRASGGDLRRHLLYLRRHYCVLPLERALEELYAPVRAGDRTGRHTSLVITFDDGYYDNYTHGLALAWELHIPLTVFLIPGYIMSGAPFWWLEGRRLVALTRVETAAIAGRTYHLNNRREREQLAGVLDARLRFAKSVAEREAFLAEAYKALCIPPTPFSTEDSGRILTWQEIQAMQESGWISFGAHTLHHPILAALVDPVEVQREVSECRELLQQHLGSPARCFAYPVGQRQHIGDVAPLVVREAGYACALTTMYGFNTPRSDPYLLRRIEVDVSQHWLVLAAETSGLWGLFTRLRTLWKTRRYARYRRM
jgi:peptidoglycan/xylan/chitin deacetylase (PgdA/CDA1 family)